MAGSHPLLRDTYHKPLALSTPDEVYTPQKTRPEHGAHPLQPAASQGPAALDLTAQEVIGGTETPNPLATKPRTDPHRRTRDDPPAACSHSNFTELHWRWLSSDGRVAPWYCDRWDCPVCAESKASKWAEIITVASPQRHLVLTRMGPDPQLARAQLRNIVKAARRGQFNGKGSRSTTQSFEYFCSMETHSCGFVHAHILQRGDSLPKARLSAALPAYGVGSICWIRSMSDAERPAAVNRYVARHLVGFEHHDQMKAGRRIRYSRNFWGGCSTAEVAAALWPRVPDATSWSLVGPPRRDPDPDLTAVRRAEHRDAARSQRLDQLLYAAIINGATEEELTRRRLIRTPPLELEEPDECDP